MPAANAGQMAVLSLGINAVQPDTRLNAVFLEHFQGIAIKNARDATADVYMALKWEK